MITKITILMVVSASSIFVNFRKLFITNAGEVFLFGFHNQDNKYIIIKYNFYIQINLILKFKLVYISFENEPKKIRLQGIFVAQHSTYISSNTTKTWQSVRL